MEEMNTDQESGNLKGRDCSGDLHVDERIISKCILKK
jgi:hypothetical protein